MLRHVVMWKLKESAEGKAKKENALEMKRRLEGLKKDIPEAKKIEVGINLGNGEQAYDAVLISEFADKKSLEAYMNHPKHKAVSEWVSKVREQRASVDYETEK